MNILITFGNGYELSGGVYTRIPILTFSDSPGRPQYSLITVLFSCMLHTQTVQNNTS